ncbi:MAG: DUF5711 family protein [Tissierellales bacterium]
MTAKEEQGKGKKLIWVIIMLLIIGVMFFGKRLSENVQNLFKQTEKSLELVQTINIPLADNRNMRSYEGTIVNFKNKTIASYNFSGDKLWSQDIDFEDPFIHLGENEIFAGDKESGQITAFNLQGEKKWTYEARQSIEKFAEKNGLLIIYTKAGEQIDQINVIDEKGKLLANTIIDKGRLLSSGIALDKKRFTLVTLDFSGSDLTSSILLYTKEGELLWKKDFQDLIILSADFIDNDNILAVSDRKIISLNMKNELLWSRDIKGRLKDTKLDQIRKEIYLLYEDENDYVEVLEKNGKTKNRLELNSYYSNIYTNKKNIYLTGENRIIGIHGDEVFLKHTCENEIKGLEFQKDDFLLLTKENLFISKLSKNKVQDNK